MLLDTLCVFLEASVHQVLHNRGVYPNELFERTKLMGIPVHRVRSQEVCDYIQEVVASVRPWLQQDLVEAMVVQLSDERTGVVLENFVFELRSSSSLCTQAIQRLPTGEVAALAVQLEAVLRPFLIKETQAGAVLGGKLETPPAPPSSSVTASPTPPSPTPIAWKVLVLTYEMEEGESLMTNMPWVEAEPGEISASENTVLVPLRSHTASTAGLAHFQLQLFVEKLESALPQA